MSAAVPRRPSTLLMVFHVSPQLKWNINANNGLHNNVPVVLKMMVALIALSKAMFDQMIGNAIGGGCHDGRSLSLNTVSFLSAFGLELSKGLKMRLRTLKKAIKNHTKNDLRGASCNDLITAGTLSSKGCGITSKGMILICIKCNMVIIKLNCTPVAAI